LAREDIEKELLRKLAEVDELKKKLNSETSQEPFTQKPLIKKKSKWPWVVGAVFAAIVAVSMLPDPTPLTPEELAAKEARVAAIKAELKASTLEKDILRTKTSLKSAIEAKQHSRVVEKYEALAKLSENSAEDFSQDYQVSKSNIEEAERIRKLNDLGNYYMGNYVDEFGDNTGQKFIGYKGSGTFSNSATEGSRLSFWIAIDSPNEFDVSLYEYAGKNPVKDIFGGDAFVMRFRYADVTGQVTCKNSSDRISCGPQNSASVINALKQANVVKFSIYNQRTTSSQYAFTVNANGFSNALRKLQE